MLTSRYPHSLLSGTSWDLAGKQSRCTGQESLRAMLQEELTDYPEVRLGDLKKQILGSELPLVEVELFGPQNLDPELAQRISDVVKTHLGGHCDVRIIHLQEWRSSP